MAISKAMAILREEALKRVVKAKNERPILVLTYNPALPSVAGIIRKHWKMLSFDKNIFTDENKF